VPFTERRNGKSINLFNIKSGKLVHGAPIKHQCSGNFFYGEDREFENLLGTLEGMYAKILREIEVGRISDYAFDWLLLFMAIQNCRTRRAADSAGDFLQKSAAVTLRGHTIKESDKPDLSHNALIFYALRQFKAIVPCLRDLQLGVIRNRTKSYFLTSDNPLIATNRFYLQKLGADNFGMLSAGALLILPVGPEFAISLYDSGMYSVENHGGFVEVKNANDITAFNEMQYVNADENIYFSRTEDGTQIVSAFELVRKQRPSEKIKLTEYAEVSEGKYRLVEGNIDDTDVKAKMISYQTPKPRVTHWPSVFKFKLKPKAYSNGSIAGYVRRLEWLTGEGCPK
jgi:hypothetical protein